MREQDDTYRFSPDDFDEDGNLTRRESDSAPLVIVGSLGVGAGVVLAGLFAGPITISGIQIELDAIAATVFAVGVLCGAGVYARRGKRYLGVVHAIGSIGWLLFAIGTVLSSNAVLVVGIAVLLASAVSLVALAWRS